MNNIINYLKEDRSLFIHCVYETQKLHKVEGILCEDEVRHGMSRMRDIASQLAYDYGKKTAEVIAESVDESGSAFNESRKFFYISEGRLVSTDEPLPAMGDNAYEMLAKLIVANSDKIYLPQRLRDVVGGKNAPRTISREQFAVQFGEDEYSEEYKTALAGVICDAVEKNVKNYDAGTAICVRRNNLKVDWNLRKLIVRKKDCDKWLYMAFLNVCTGSFDHGTYDLTYEQALEKLSKED